MESASGDIGIKLEDPFIVSKLGIGGSGRRYSSSCRLRMISKESSNQQLSMSAPSHYYRNDDVVAGTTNGVPFLWESIPGTPKHPHHSGLPFPPPPPLTPPPSFFQKPPTTALVVPAARSSRFNLLRHLLRRRSGTGSFSSSRKPAQSKYYPPSRCSSSVSFSPSCSSSLSSDWTSTTTTTTTDGGQGASSGGGWRWAPLKCSSRFCFVLPRNNSWSRRSNGYPLIHS